MSSSLTEILKPLREQVEASGITDAEFEALIEEGREEHAQMTDPDPPRARLLRLLGDEEAQARVAQAAALLALPPIRLWMLEAGMWTPPGRELHELIPALVQMGFRATPVGFPTELGVQDWAGSLYVLTDEARTPCEVGWIQRMSTDLQWFFGVNTERRRLQVSQVAYWLLAAT